MKKFYISVMVAVMLIMASACSSKQIMAEDTKPTTQVTAEPGNDVTTDSKPTQRDETDTAIKETLSIRPADTADDDLNNDELIVSDNDGNEAQIQIGVATGEVAEDAPDVTTSNNATTAPTEATEHVTAPTIPPQTSGQIGPDLTTTYLEYEAMSGTEQTLFYYSFADADAFLEWYNAAKQAYEEGREDIYIGVDGTPES